MLFSNGTCNIYFFLWRILVKLVGKQKRGFSILSSSTEWHLILGGPHHWIISASWRFILSCCATIIIFLLWVVHHYPFSLLAKEEHWESKLSCNMDVLMIRFQRRKQRKLKFFTTTLLRHWLWRKKKWWVLKNHWRLLQTHLRNNSKTKLMPGQCYRLVRPSLHIIDAAVTQQTTKFS